MFSPTHALGHFRLKRRRSKSIPILIDLVLIKKQPSFGGRKIFQPLNRAAVNARRNWNRDINRQFMPMETAREQYHICFVRPHPIRQRALVRDPTAEECAAGIDRTAIIMGAIVPGTERALFAWLDPLAGDDDPEPSIATCRTRSAMPDARGLILDGGVRHAWLSRKL